MGKTIICPRLKLFGWFRFPWFLHRVPWQMVLYSFARPACAPRLSKDHGLWFKCVGSLRFARPACAPRLSGATIKENPGLESPGFDYFSSNDWITSAAAVILSQKYSTPVRLPVRACDSKHSVDDLISDTAAFSTLMLCSLVISILLSLVNDWWIMYHSTRNMVHGVNCLTRLSNV